jgi:hypothetical protein
VCLQSIKFATERSAGSRSYNNLSALRTRRASEDAHAALTALKPRRISEDAQAATFLHLPDHAVRSGPREVCFHAWCARVRFLCGGGGLLGSCQPSTLRRCLPARLRWRLCCLCLWCSPRRALGDAANQLRITRLLLTRVCCLPDPPWTIQTIYFDPKDTHAAICTVGGICPGLNDVVRSLVHKARSRRRCRPSCSHRSGLRCSEPAMVL